MKVVLSTIGKFHTFDLAREMHSRGMLEAVFTGYPMFKLRTERLPPGFIRSFPWVHAPYMGFSYRPRLGVCINRLWEYVDRITLDRFVSKSMPACDVFVGLSGSALESGRAARARGARYVCDRGSSHIRTQDSLLREEHARWGVKFPGVDPRIIDLEEAEYAESDRITVPSSFNVASFVAQGVAAEKMIRIPYGVNLERFHPTASPDPTRFDVLFVGGMSLRKGVPYLLEAYLALEHPRKSLTFAGFPDPDFIALMKQRSLWPGDVKVLGHVPQQGLKDIMSRSHVLVLPSVEEGLATVQAQALACGCPVIGTDHTGAADLFDDDREGFIVRIRDSREILDRLQRFIDEPGLRARMSEAALARVERIGGWRAYGDQAAAAYEALR